MDTKRLRQKRKEKKLTQTELANKVGTTKGTISNYETGHSTPSHDILCKLADVLDTTTDYLLGRAEYRQSTMKRQHLDESEIIQTINSLYKLTEEKRKTVINLIKVLQNDDILEDEDSE